MTGDSNDRITIIRLEASYLA